MAGLSGYEQEVTIIFNAVDETAEIYTANPVWTRKMDKLVEQNPKQFKLERVGKCEGKIISKSYSFPKKFITIRSKETKRELTEEQRAELAERLNRSR